MTAPPTGRAPKRELRNTTKLISEHVLSELGSAPRAPGSRALGRPTCRRSTARSASPPRPAIPPVARRFIADDSRSDLNVPHVAELPEFLSRSRVLKDDFVDFERGDLTSLKAFEGWLDATDELAQLLLVIGSDDLASSPTI